MTSRLKNNAHNWTEIWARRMDDWNRCRARGKGAVSSREFWNGFDLWEEYEPFTRYPGKLLGALLDGVDKHTTVLDIGAGSGAIALPAAEAVQSVTALEPSSAQMRRLRDKAGRAGIENMVLVEHRWEEVEIEEIGPHDVVVASYSLFMTDIAAALRKMAAAARKRIFLVHLAGHDLQGLVRRLRGDGTAMPSLRVLLKVLEEMGLAHRLQIFHRRFELPLHLQMKMLQYSQGFSLFQLEALRKHLEECGRIHSTKSVPWLQRRYHDALITIDAI